MDNTLIYGSSGVLLNNVTGQIGGSGTGEGIAIVGGRPGIWNLNGQSGAATLSNFDIQNARGVGLGMSHSIGQFNLEGGVIADTHTLPPSTPT